MQMIPFEERDHTAILVDVGYLSTEVMAVEGDASSGRRFCWSAARISRWI